MLACKGVFAKPSILQPCEAQGGDSRDFTLEFSALR